MRRANKTLSLMCMALAALLAGCSENGRLRAEASAGAVPAAAAEPLGQGRMPIVASSARLDVAPRSLRSPETTRLALRTPEGRALNLLRTRQERVGTRGVAWHARVEDDPAGSAVLIENEGALAGSIFTSSGTYNMRGSERAGVVIERLNPAAFPPEGEPIPRAGRVGVSADPAADTCTTDSGADIDVMVVYTDDTRAAAGETAAMEAEVYLAVAVSNQTYLNSNVTQRLRLVHTAEVSYGETGNANTDLTWLQGNAQIAALRNTFAADNVVMLTQTLDYCGLAYFMNSVGNAFHPSAYGVVLRSCASGNLSFPHELGHNMGATHDWAADQSTTPYLFAHGYQRPTPSVAGTLPWRTVMAYACQVTCGRIPYWSNPNVFYPGPTADPMGVSGGAQPADNAQVLNLTAQTVANFRCSSAGRTDVWMKDRWSDTGAEPEPLTAGQPMWESPYIWVRNTQDVNLLHQHEHENPEFGSPNWAYVKLHNGGPAQTGNLELWVAQASTGLGWPGSWTQIGSVPATIAASSTRVVEIPWPTLPGTGHFCLVARWVSASDPMNAEGSDINANTINNNNIVWRNVNIVDLAGDALETFSVRIANPTRERALATLRFHFPRNANQRSFASFGQIDIRFDDRLATVAGRNTRPVGLVRGARGWSFARGAEEAQLQGLVLAPGQEGVVTIGLRRPARSPQDVYRLRVEQWLEPTAGGTRDRGRRLVGGVSYDIRTGRRINYVAPRGE